MGILWNEKAWAFQRFFFNTYSSEAKERVLKRIADLGYELREMEIDTEEISEEGSNLTRSGLNLNKVKNTRKTR